MACDALAPYTDGLLVNFRQGFLSRRCDGFLTIGIVGPQRLDVVLLRPDLWSGIGVALIASGWEQGQEVMGVDPHCPHADVVP